MIPGSEAHVLRHQRELARFFAAQRDGIGGGDPSSARWNDELEGIVHGLAIRTVQAFAREIADRFGVTVDARDLEPFLRPYSRISAEAINATTRDNLDTARESDDPTAVDHLWTVAIGARALQIAQGKVTTEANLGRDFAAKEGGARTKRWVVTSRNPRSSHAQMSGEEVPISETFSNGAEWPGDPSLAVEERANCGCMVDFSGATE